MRILGSGVFLTLLALVLAATTAAPADAQDKEVKDKDVKAKQAKEEKTFEIPYKFTTANHIVVRAKINGKGPFNFVLDTGAPALFVAVPIGKKARVKADEDGWADLDKLELEGGLVLKKARARIETPFQLEGMNGLGLAGLEIHGLMGYNILAKYRMTFDFTRHKLVFTELDYKPDEPFKLKGKGGGGIGGLEVMGQAMKLIGQFLGRKPVPEVTLRGFFGMTLADVDGDPVVEAVLEAGPAGKAGLKKGDIVTKVEDEKVSKVTDIVKQTANLKGGDSLTLTVKRGNETKEITIKVGEGI
jgi:hypothetical protein